MNKRWSQETILAAIDDYVARHNKLPVGDHWRRAGGTENGRYPSKRTVEVYFGSWGNALRTYQALPTSTLNVEVRSNHEWTKDEVLNAFKKWAEGHDGNPPTTQDAIRASGRKRRALPTPGVADRLFGSWNNAIAQAGFVPLPRGTTRRAMRKFKPLARSR